MQVGISWVNTWFLRDLRSPFGGVGLSGIGREGGELLAALLHRTDERVRGAVSATRLVPEPAGRGRSAAAGPAAAARPCAAGPRPDRGRGLDAAYAVQQTQHRAAAGRRPPRRAAARSA